LILLLDGDLDGDRRQLFLVARTNRPSPGFLGSAHSRQQQSDEQCDNRNHHQQFDQRKCSAHWRAFRETPK